MRHLNRLYAYFPPYNKRLVRGTICVFLAGGFGMLSLLMLNYAVAYGLQPQEVDGRILGVIYSTNR